MAYLYVFCDGDDETNGIPRTSLVDVGEEWEKVLKDLDHGIFNDDRSENDHKAFSMDEYEFGGFDISDPVDYEEEALTNAHRDSMLSHLSETHQRRVLMKEAGFSCREIGRKEGVSNVAIKYSLDVAKRKMKEK